MTGKKYQQVSNVQCILLFVVFRSIMCGRLSACRLICSLERLPHKRRTRFSQGVQEMLEELSKLFCKDGEIVFDECRVGRGRAGAGLLSDIARITGVPASGPQESIYGFMGMAGWLTTYTKIDPNATLDPHSCGIAVIHGGTVIR